MTDLIDLAYGTSTAVVSPVGASLRDYTVAGRPVVVETGTSDGAVLAPWPNRIADGRYEFDGTVHQLPITEPARNTALHGLVIDVEWDVVEATETSVTLTTQLSPSPGYPFRFLLTVRYDLGEEGLRVHARAENIGTQAAPFGFGFHPWFHPGGEYVDAAQLVIPAGTWLVPDERLIPVESRPFDDGSEVPLDHEAEMSDCLTCKDFRALRSVDGTQLDDAFGQPRRDPDGRSRARLRGADGRETVIDIDSGFRNWQVYTGDELDDGLSRRALAIEPMTCPPNAFATGEDVDVVEPGGTLAVEWGIRLV